MFKHLLLAALIAAAPAACLHAAEPAPSATSDSAAKQTLDAFFAAQWERGLRESPERATYSGDTRFNERLGDYSRAANEKPQAEDPAAPENLPAIEPDPLEYRQSIGKGQRGE